MKKTIQKFLLLLLILPIGYLLTACESSEKKAQSSEELTIIASFYPMYEFTKQVVGGEGTVELLLSAGTEPHDYEPSPKDLEKIAKADVFIYNSEHLETWVNTLSETFKSNDTFVIEASQNIQLTTFEDDDTKETSIYKEDHSEDEHSHGLDPHVWLDPVLAKKEVETIRDQLIKQVPDKKEVFEKNAASYIAKLEALDQTFKEAFANATNRTFVTQHAAFGYLAKQYNLTQESITLAAEQEPSPSRLAELKQLVEDENIKVIYFESSTSKKIAQTLANETGVEIGLLNPLESLTNDQLKNKQDYISIMKENLVSLKKSIN